MQIIIFSPMMTVGNMQHLRLRQSTVCHNTGHWPQE